MSATSVCVGPSPATVTAGRASSASTAAVSERTSSFATIDAEFEWGYEGAGPRRLAQAILNDFLGFNVDLIVASAFLRDLVARLPSEFELAGGEIASWINDRLV
jgi:hypothetical protein